MADTGRIERRVGYTTGTPSVSDNAPGVASGATTPEAYNQIVNDSSSFSVTLDSGNRNAIQWIAAKTHILIGTTGGEWRLSGHSNKPFTPTNYDLKPQTYHGSKDMQAMRVSDAIVFVNGPGRKLYKMEYNGVEENYAGFDLTVLAEHITAV
jgi:hypothetical protein